MWEFSKFIKEVRLNEEAIKARLSQGAQPTETVRRLLVNASILTAIPRPVAVAAAAPSA